MKTLGKIQCNEDDSSYHDPHQESQDDQECPRSAERFFMTIFQPHSFITSKPVNHLIFLNLKIQFYDDDSSHHDPHQEGQDDQEYPPSTVRFLMANFSIETLCIIYFWKP